MPLRFRLAALLGSAVLHLAILAPIAPAQELLRQLKGSQNNDWFGWDVAGLSDLDGDGVNDFAVGAVERSTSSSFAGAVSVYSGRTFAELFTVDGYGFGDGLGHGIDLLGDVDGDGIDDLIAGAPNFAAFSGYVLVLSGADGSYIDSVGPSASNTTFGDDVAGLGDVDGDGIPDFAVGEPWEATNGTNSGRVSVWSGATRTFLWSALGVSGHRWLGNGVDAIQDLDGDGVREVLVGAPAKSDGTQTGSVHVYSGASGAFIFTINGVANGDQFGVDVAAIGDRDGDGIEDILVGAPENDLGGVEAGAAYVFSSATQSQLGSSAGDSQTDAYGWRVADVGDVNGDGLRDYGVSAIQDDRGAKNAGIVDLFSGASGERLYRFQSNKRWGWMGSSLAGLGDVDGDGFGDLVIGVSGNATDSNGPGQARVFAGNDLFTSADPQEVAVNQLFTLAIREGTPGNLVLSVIVDIDGVPTFFAPFGLTTFDATGGVTWSSNVPSSASGHSVAFLTFAIDANGDVVSSAVESVTIK